MTLVLNFCDLSHQAVAFLGTCPLCAIRDRGQMVVKPLREGRDTLCPDLKQALRAHYDTEENARLREAIYRLYDFDALAQAELDAQVVHQADDEGAWDPPVIVPPSDPLDTARTGLVEVPGRTCEACDAGMKQSAGGIHYWNDVTAWGICRKLTRLPR